MIERSSNLKLFKINELPVNKPEFLIEGIMERNTTCAIIGHSGSGKTFYMLYLACSIASGRSFFENKVSNPGPVIYIAGEGHSGIPNRIEAICNELKVKSEELNLFISSTSIELTEKRSINNLIELIDEVTREISQKPVAIFFDTLNRNYGPGDESSASDMGKVISSTDLLRSRYYCSIVFAHHVGVSNLNRARGSSAFYAALDMEFLMSKKINQKTIQVRNTKFKDGPLLAPQKYCLESVSIKDKETDDNIRIETAVLRSIIDQDSTLIDQWKPRGTQQNKILKIIANAFFLSKGEPIQYHIIRMHCSNENIDRQRLSEIKKKLSDNRIIQYTKDQITILDESFFKPYISCPSSPP